MLWQNRLSAIDILVALGGLIVGLVIGALLTYPFPFFILKLLPAFIGDFRLWDYWFGFSNNSQEDIIMIFTGIPK